LLAKPVLLALKDDFATLISLEDEIYPKCSKSSKKEKKIYSGK
jgi:hypothetical protein